MGDLHVSHVNWSKTNTNDNRIVEILDYNVIVSIKFNPATGSFGGITPKSVSYKEAKMHFYGMGKRGNTWKGSMLTFSEEK